MRSSRPLRVAVAALVAAGLLALVLRRVPLDRVLALIFHAPPGLLLAAGLCALSFNAVRGIRYRVLLAGPDPPRLETVIATATTAWGVSLALPGLVGDAFWVWLLRSAGRVPLARGTGAAVLARSADLASLALIGLVSAPLAGARLPAAAQAAMAGAAVLVAALMAALLWPPARGALLGRLGAVPGLARPARSLEDALAGMGGRRRLAALAATTGLARLISAFEYLALFAAIGLPLAFWQATLAVSIRTLLLGLPVQGLAGLGTAQLWWTAALTLLGWRLATALAASLAVHLLDLAVSIPVALAGAAALARIWRDPASAATAVGARPDGGRR